jgi:hypothetical protein
MNERKKLWWLAFNGTTVSPSLMPFVNPVVTPTPEQLLGFPSQSEQLEVLQYLRTASAADKNRYICERMPKEVQAGRLVYKRLFETQLPSREGTNWTEGGEIEIPALILEYRSEYERQQHDLFREVCLSERPVVQTALDWLGFIEGPTDRSRELETALRRLLEALHRDDPRLDLQPLPALQRYFRPGCLPHVSRQLLNLIHAGLAHQQAESIASYAYDLYFTSRYYCGPEWHAWSPFCYRIDGRQHGLLMGIYDHLRASRYELRVVFCLIDEVFAFGSEQAAT